MPALRDFPSSRRDRQCLKGTEEGPKEGNLEQDKVGAMKSVQVWVEGRA